MQSGSSWQQPAGLGFLLMPVADETWPHSMSTSSNTLLAPISSHPIRLLGLDWILRYWAAMVCLPGFLGVSSNGGLKFNTHGTRTRSHYNTWSLSLVSNGGISNHGSVINRQLWHLIHMGHMLGEEHHGSCVPVSMDGADPCFNGSPPMRGAERCPDPSSWEGGGGLSGTYGVSVWSVSAGLLSHEVLRHPISMRLDDCCNSGLAI